LFEVAVKSLCQVADNAQAASLPELSWRDAVIFHLASHQKTGLREFDANTSFSDRKGMTRRVCNKFVYNHSHPPALFRLQAQRACRQDKIYGQVI
jgi:hypothetical protein